MFHSGVNLNLLLGTNDRRAEGEARRHKHQVGYGKQCGSLGAMPLEIFLKFFNKICPFDILVFLEPLAKILGTDTFARVFLLAGEGGDRHKQTQINTSDV